MASTCAISSSGEMVGSSTVIAARSVAKFTLASTPSILLSRLAIRAAHEAHVMPPISSSSVVFVAMSGFSVIHRWSVASDDPSVERELGGVDGVVVLEVEEQPVAAGGRQRCFEAHDAVLVAEWMHVGVGEIAGPERDEVSGCAQVRLQVRNHMTGL